MTEQEKVAAEAAAKRAEAERPAAEKKEAKRIEADKLAAEQAARAKKPEAKGLAILKNYPDKSKAYVTSDGFVFFEHSDAANHAATLSKKDVITVNKQ